MVLVVWLVVLGFGWRSLRIRDTVPVYGAVACGDEQKWFRGWWSVGWWRPDGYEALRAVRK